MLKCRSIPLCSKLSSGFCLIPSKKPKSFQWPLKLCCLLQLPVPLWTISFHTSLSAPAMPACLLFVFYGARYTSASGLLHMLSLLFWNSLLPNIICPNPSSHSGLYMHESLPQPMGSNYRVLDTSLLSPFLLALFTFHYTLSFKCLPSLLSVFPPLSHPRVWAPGRQGFLFLRVGIRLFCLLQHLQHLAGGFVNTCWIN